MTERRIPIPGHRLEIVVDQDVLDSTGLAPREQELALCLAKGLSDWQVAEELGVSRKACEANRKRGGRKILTDGRKVMRSRDIMFELLARGAIRFERTDA